MHAVVRTPHPTLGGTGRFWRSKQTSTRTCDLISVSFIYKEAPTLYALTVVSNVQHRHYIPHEDSSSVVFLSSGESLGLQALDCIPTLYMGKSCPVHHIYIK